MTSNSIYLSPSNIEQVDIGHEYDKEDDTLTLYLRVFDTRRGIKRGFQFGITKELFEILAEDIGEGMEYPIATGQWYTPGYRREENDGT